MMLLVVMVASASPEPQCGRYSLIDKRFTIGSTDGLPETCVATCADMDLGPA